MQRTAVWAMWEPLHRRQESPEKGRYGPAAGQLNELDCHDRHGANAPGGRTVLRPRRLTSETTLGVLYFGLARPSSTFTRTFSGNLLSLSGDTLSSGASIMIFICARPNRVRG